MLPPQVSAIVSSASEYTLRSGRISGVLPPANGSVNCNMNTGGTCALFPCDTWRNAQCDYSSRCVCSSGFCATVNGSCIRLAANEGQQLFRPNLAIGASMKMAVLKLPQVSGTMPESWCMFSRAIQLNLRDMMSVSGSLPNCLGSMRLMVNLVASNLSRVSGHVPLSIGQMTSIFTVELSCLLWLSGALLDAGTLL